MRKYLPFLFILLAVLFDTAVFPVITDTWLYPLTALTSVIALGLLLGRTRGALFGMVAGILLDTTTSLPFGLMIVLYTIAGAGVGFAGRLLRKGFLSTLLIPLCCLVLFEIGMMGYATLAGSDFSFALVRRAGIRALLNTGLSLGWFWLYGRCLTPDQVRYTAR